MSDAQTTADSAAISRPILVKLVLLGEAAVGKSSVVLRFVQNDFQENKEPTWETTQKKRIALTGNRIGAAFLTQKCRLEDKSTYGIQQAKNGFVGVSWLIVTSLNGKDSLAPMYYRNAAAAVVVSDVTSAASFDKAKSWIKELQRQANPNIVIALVNNKVDLVQADDQSPVATREDEQDDGSEDSEADDATATPSARVKAASTSGNVKQDRQVLKEEASAYAQEHSLLFFETSAKTGEGVVEVFTEIAKKIPLDQYAGSGRTGPGSRNSSGRGAAAGQANAREGRVNLNNAQSDAKKDACAC